MKIKFNSVIRYGVVCLLGILLHFTYNWSGKNPVVGLFSAINESTWEHLKLLFFPLLLVTIIDLLLKNENREKFLSSRTIGILFGLLFLVVSFYTIWGVLGVLIDVINISLYFSSVLVAFFTEHKINSKDCSLRLSTSVTILLLLTLLFFLFSKYPPNLGLFLDVSFHRAFNLW